MRSFCLVVVLFCCELFAGEQFPFELNHSINWESCESVRFLSMRDKVVAAVSRSEVLRASILRGKAREDIRNPLLVLDCHHSVFWCTYVVTKEKIIKMELNLLTKEEEVQMLKPQSLFLRKVESVIAESKNFKSWYGIGGGSTLVMLGFLTVAKEEGDFRTIVWDAGIPYWPSGEYRVLINFAEELEDLFNKRTVNVPLCL